MPLKPVFLLLIPLSLSAFTHIWNPSGFPDIFFDEGVYIGRALHILAGLGPQETQDYYDHPFFGQIFLAAVFKLIGYPDNMLSSSVNDSIESLYAAPRILMGLLAIVDTFLIYKMTERRYNTTIAFMAAILFAVMPMSWFTRRIMLDSILLPLLLSSILTAVWLRKKQNIGYAVEENGYAKKYNKIPLVLLSGIFLGLAIFTKIPVVVMIPLVGYLIFSNSNRKWMLLGLWLIPVILIPLIWPAYSITKGQFQYWVDTAVYQATRSGAPLFDTLAYNFTIDPVLYILFFGGLILAVLRKNLFILLWAIPFLIFLYVINWAPYTSLIPLIPVFCISSAILLHDIVTFVIRGKYERWAHWSTISAIGIFGLLSTSVLLTLNVTSTQFQTMSYVTKFFQNDKNAAETYMLVSSPVYSWIFNYIYKINFVLRDYYDYEYQSIKPEKILLIADGEFQYSLEDKILAQLYKETQTIKAFKPNEILNNLDTEKYPYTSLNENGEGLSEIEVRIKDNNIVESDLKNCIEFDEHTILVTCQSADLTDIYNNLDSHDASPLSKESNKTWILNANLGIKKDSTLYLNSTDTSWLKINSTSGMAHEIKVEGNLAIDSVKITGWDTIRNDYPTIDQNGTIPRSYILIKNGNGLTNISNSEIAYLGYKHGRSFGLTYDTGAGGVLTNNTIHDLWFGFNAQSAVYSMTIKNNHFYNNSVYGMYLNNGAHDTDITNNKVYDNGKHGIICSTGCYNITVEANEVFDNPNEGILFSKNVSNSVISGNKVYNNTDQIAIYDNSTNNTIYNNNVFGGKVGIRLNTGSAYNHIYNNSIMNSDYGVYILGGASNNTVDSNKIKDSSNTALYIKDNNTNHNVFKNNILVDNRKNEVNRNLLNPNGTLFINNTIQSTNRIQ